MALGVDKQASVLLVEDDHALRRMLEVTLRRAGYHVISAADGVEAMKLALSSPVDIVVTDAMMPNLSSQAFCRLLRGSPNLSHIKAILLSGLDREEGSPERELADAFLSKPVLKQDLTDCIELLLLSA
ncbi:MAG: response regulator [Pyrinomonadaceae bacterium]